jgi:iron complex outermembrane receptor protein
MRSNSMFHAMLRGSTAFIALAALPIAAHAQDTGTGREILVTGSRIKQDPNKSALPLEIISNETIQQNGISSPEQLTMFLTSTGNGADNLASNSDVTSGAQRGTNGLSGINLRGQGSAATLVLLNGRRVAAHGLSGSAVDVNQIPFAAIDRVEILKDGASAIYGTDAIGGVVNYITKKNYTGVGASAFTDVTQHGGGNIYNISGIVGLGDLKTKGWNVFGAVSYRWNQILRGSDRSFVNTNQPNAGLSVDTRGTPIATAFGTGSATFPSLLRNLTLTAPNGANAVTGGINVLNLPGGAGCGSMDGGMAYDYGLWANPTAYYACAWDTGRAAVIQQPINTLTYYSRGTVELGRSEAYVEVTGSDAKSAKSFSNNQLTTSTSSLPIFYPLNALTADTYNAVFNSIKSAFSGNAAQVAALQANYGLPIAFRWRCIPCGTREYATDAKTFRIAGGVDGPLPIEGWDYRTGASYATSAVSSTLGAGYFYRGTLSSAGTVADPAAPTAPGATSPGIVGLINSGILNPFSLTQSAAAMAGLNAISATGATLYGGKYKTLQADASISGPLFALPGGSAKLALGVDYRRETYEFNGSDAATGPVIFNAAFDNINALTPQHRTVKAVYGELALPITEWFELSGALRLDDYSGFGSTTNPKFTAKFTPASWLMLRGSYSTGFRVPSFNQIFNGVTESPYTGADLVDPAKCPGGVVSATNANCAVITPTILTGGRTTLGPETAKEASAGLVLRPNRNWSLTADWYMINVENSITILTLQQLVGNYNLFADNFLRDSTGTIAAIDDRYVNAGARRTQGVEFTVRGTIPLGAKSRLDVGMDGSLLLKKKEKLTQNSAYGPSLIGVFTYAGDLGLRWKHNIWLTWANDNLAVTLTQMYRAGYANQVLPGIANGTVTRADFNPRVSPYITYNLSATVLQLRPGFQITGSIKNLFDKDPPFAITYDSNSGAGSSWEPRVADPRGRSFTLAVDIKY